MSELKNLLVVQLQYLLDVEVQLTRALPKMADAAHNPVLKAAFQKHLAQTEEHVTRVTQALELMGGSAEAKTSAGIAGLVAEGEEVIASGKKLPAEVADAALAGAAQCVEHYEIARYGTLRSVARLIGEPRVATLLEANLSEEEAADFLLTTVAKPILQQAATESHTEKTRKREAVAVK